MSMGQVIGTARTQGSPDITQPPPSLRTYEVCESQCERSLFIWEIVDKSLSHSVIPMKVIVDPTDPDHDSSQSRLDLTPVPSGSFVRGQEIEKPVEWSLVLSKDTTSGEVLVTLTCGKIYTHATVPALAQVALDIIDEDGVASWCSGDIHEAEVKAYSPGTHHNFKLGKMIELQEKRDELIKNGIIRFRLRLNIYKDSKQAGESKERLCDMDNRGTKRLRVEDGSASELAKIQKSLELSWTSKEQSGDITIRCEEREIKAHKFILSTHSAVFRQMLSGEIKSTEKSTSTIQVDDISPEILTALLEYLYLGRTTRFDWVDVNHLCAMIYAADKYMIASLMEKCYQSLMKIMNLQNFGKIAKVTFMYNSGKQFKDEVRHFYQSNQITLNDIDSFRSFAKDDFTYFYKLFFYPS